MMSEEGNGSHAVEMLARTMEVPLTTSSPSSSSSSSRTLARPLRDHTGRPVNPQQDGTHRMSSCCYGELHGVVVTNAWYSGRGRLNVSARRTGVGQGGAGPFTASVALGEDEDVLATQLIAGGSLLTLFVEKNRGGIQDRIGDGTCGGGRQIDLVIVDLWSPQVAGGGGGPATYRRGVSSFVGHATGLHVVNVGDCQKSMFGAGRVGGIADRWAGAQFIVLSSGVAPGESRRSAGMVSLLVFDASWVVRGEGNIGSPYELHSAQTLQGSLTSMVSWPLQWLDASGSAKAQGASVNVAMTGSRLKQDGACSVGLVAYSNAKCGAVIKQWQVRLDSNADVNNFLSNEIPLFRPAGGAASASAANDDTFDAEKDVVEKIHISDGGCFVVAAVRRQVWERNARRSHYRLISWRVSGGDAPGNIRTEHLSTRMLADVDEPAQLVVANDGTVTWFSRDEGNGDSMSPAEVHSYDSKLMGGDRRTGGTDRVFTFDCGMRMELPVAEHKSGPDDINRAAFIADWIQRRICENVEGQGGATTSNHIAKSIMADALAQRMLSSNAGWCSASAAKVLQVTDSRFDIVTSRGSLAKLLLEYAEEEVGDAGRNSTAAVLSVFRQICSRYYALVLQSREPMMLFSVSCPYRTTRDSPPLSVSGILRARDGISIFTEFGRISELSAHEMYRLSSLGWMAGAPTGSMTRIAVDAAQARGIGVLDDLMPILASGALGERVLSSNESDWLNHASEIRNTLSKFFDSLGANRGEDAGLVHRLRKFVLELEATTVVDGEVGSSLASKLSNSSKYVTMTMSFVGSRVASAVSEVSLSIVLLMSVLGKIPDALGLNMHNVLDMRSETKTRVMHLLTVASTLKLLCGGIVNEASPGDIATSLSVMDDSRRLATLTLQSAALRQLPRTEDIVTVFHKLLAGGKVDAPVTFDVTFEGPTEIGIVGSHAALLVTQLFGGLLPNRHRMHSFVDLTPSIVDIGLMLFTSGFFDEIGDIMAFCEGLPRCGCRYAMMLLRGLSSIARRRRVQDRATSLGRDAPKSECDRLESEACSLLIEAGAGIGHESKLNELFQMLVPELTGLGEQEAIETLGPLSRAQYYEVIMIMFERYNCLRGACEMGTAALREIMSSTTAFGGEEANKMQHTRVSHNLFKYLCDLRDFTEAYNVLRHIPLDDGHSTCLQRLAVLMIECGAVQDLVSIPYGSHTREVELSLQDRALMSPISVATPMYEKLFVFHVSRSQHLSAAKCMAECACRVGTETGLERGRQANEAIGISGSLALLASMKHALLAAINALRLVEDSRAWVNVAFDETNDFDYATFKSQRRVGNSAVKFSHSPQLTLDLVSDLVQGSDVLDSMKSFAGSRAEGKSDFSKRVKVLTGSGLRVRLAVTCARIELLSWSSQHAAKEVQERHLSIASVDKLMTALVSARLHIAALQLGLQLVEADNEHFGYEALEMALSGFAKHCCEVNCGRQAPRTDANGDVDMASSPLGGGGSVPSPLAHLERDMMQHSELPSAASLDIVLGGVGLMGTSLSAWDRLRVTVQGILSKHGEARLWKAVAGAILDYDRRMRLPVWLVDLGAGINCFDVVKVLMKYDLVYEAADQVIEAISLWREKHSNKGPGQTFFPRKVLDELRLRLENLGSGGCSSDDEYILRCIQMRDDLDDEWRRYSETIDKYGIIAQSM